jgi:nitrite reductase (NO-forming)
MYGMMIVEPTNGYPTKVDREYVIVQSEFYAHPDPNGREVDCAPLHVLDGERLRAAQPTHTVFNGVHNGMVANPLSAKAGERVRLFVLNVGPSRTSSFHVVGTILDRVWFEGNPDNQFRGMQTVLLGSSNSAIVEFMIPEAGSYIMVDHHFANASQGAVGLISTEAKPNEAELEHHNFPATATPTDPNVLRAKLDFESKCLACHSIGQGAKLGPDLAGVTKRRSDAWLSRWLQAPDKMLESDADAKAMLAEWNNVPMPNQNLSDAEVADYVRFFHWVDAQPAGSVKPSMAGH